MTNNPSLVESVPMDRVIDRTASEGVQLAQAEGWIRQLMASYQSIQQTCANKDAAITRLRAELETERRKVEAASQMMNAAIALDLVAMLNHDTASARHELREKINAFLALAALTPSEKGE